MLVIRALLTLLAMMGIVFIGIILFCGVIILATFLGYLIALVIEIIIEAILNLFNKE